MTNNPEQHPGPLPDLDRLRRWARESGFERCGVADTEDASPLSGLQAWLAAGFHGEMSWLARDPAQRADPRQLRAGTRSAIMVALDYAPKDPQWVERAWQALAASERAYVSRYALGRDYHRIVRRRLQRLAERIAAEIGPFGYRVYCDSAPVMEVELAARAGIGWRGKHTLLIDRGAGSTFFIGTLFSDLPLAGGEPLDAHCGTCERCIDICPTRAIVAPYRLDARRCISYLTIENPGPIPEPMRAAIGNRIYGCDDCQLVCPWNRWAQAAAGPEFEPRDGLADPGLVELFGWSEDEFLARMAGSPIRRIGHRAWLRNLAVAMGNALADRSVATGAQLAIRRALRARADHESALVREHVAWALAQGQV